MSSYRTKPVSPDYRRTAKTSHWCALCQRDLTDTTERWIAYELDNPLEIIHPDDLSLAWEEIPKRRAPHHARDCIVFERVGPECARRLGKSWWMTRDEMLRHYRADSMVIEYYRPLAKVQ